MYRCTLPMVMFRAISIAVENLVKSSSYTGKYFTFNGTMLTIVDRCNSSKLIFAKCPQPQCGRKGPSTVKEANSGSISKRPSTKSSPNRNPPDESFEDRMQNLLRVVGGKSSAQGSWPWVVALHRNGAFQCGASLLNSRWIISASHCFLS